MTDGAYHEADLDDPEWVRTGSVGCAGDHGRHDMEHLRVVSHDRLVALLDAIINSKIYCF